MCWRSPVLRQLPHAKPMVAFMLNTFFTLLACAPMSEHIKDPSAGLNGSFEVARDGLPVNWLLYTPKTLADADFAISLDTHIYREGKQSLKFSVEKCSPSGGWRSPGFTNEFFSVGKYSGPARYRLSCWVKNDGAAFHISAGAVNEKSGNMQTLMEEERSIHEWKFLEWDIEIPAQRWLRLQLNVVKPGRFWIDDIRVEKLATTPQ